MKPTLGTTLRNLRPRRFGLVLIIVAVLLAGCAPQAQATPVPTLTTMLTPSAAPSETPQPLETATLAATPANQPTPILGWETYKNPGFKYTISYPIGMEGAANGDYSWTLMVKLANPDAGARNFIYVSVIPANFQGKDGDIYNYNKPEADILLNMQVGESKSLREGVAINGFTYTRKPDTIVSGQAAKTYENTQPWEFPAGTMEIRYYLQTDANTYLIGGYIDTSRADLPGNITAESFNQMIATFQLLP